MRTIICLLVVGLLIGCTTATRTVYGPEATPDQIRDAVYEDAYSVAMIRVVTAAGRIERDMKEKNAELENPQSKDDINKQILAAKIRFLDTVQTRIDLVRGSSDPMAIVNQYWYEEMVRTDDPERTAVIALAGLAGRRVLNRIGIKAIETEITNRFEAVDFDMKLFQHAVDAYEAGVQDFREKVK